MTIPWLAAGWTRAGTQGRTWLTRPGLLRHSCTGPDRPLLPCNCSRRPETFRPGIRVAGRLPRADGRRCAGSAHLRRESLVPNREPLILASPPAPHCPGPPYAGGATVTGPPGLGPARPRASRRTPEIFRLRAGPPRPSAARAELLRERDSVQFPTAVRGSESGPAAAALAQFWPVRPACTARPAAGQTVTGRPASRTSQ